MAMDNKAVHIFEHYKYLIENRLFDEYDILGFLIFIRSYLKKKKYPLIYDYCDLIAHRMRNCGRTMESIEQAIQNNYETLPNSKAVKGYTGITKEQWDEEWSRFGIEYKIHLSLEAISEIVLCIFSLTQFTTYTSDKGSGIITLWQEKGGSLSLNTAEGRPDSYYVCFSKYGPYEFLREHETEQINTVVETRRVGTVLQLYAGDTRII